MGVCDPFGEPDPPNNICRRCCAGPVGTSTTSSRVFQAPQSGHFPSHLLCSPPHCWQMYFVRTFGMNPFAEEDITKEEGGVKHSRPLLY